MKKKFIQILSNGSLIFLYKNHPNFYPYKFYEKDNCNFLKKKNHINITNANYKNKYIF